MSARLAKKIPEVAYAMHPDNEPLPAIGAAHGGGYIGAIMPWTNDLGAIAIVSAAAEGDFGSMEWDPKYKAAPGATSFTDGLANSISIDDDNHPAAQKCRALRIGGYEDWHLLSMAHQIGVMANCCPIWTQLEAFRRGGRAAYQETAYWSSTQSQFDSGLAWHQYFGLGYSNTWNKAHDLRVRAGRLILFKIKQFPAA